MILYIFNNYFPDGSGFSKRCQREIEALSELEEVTVICRGRKNETRTEVYPSNLKIIRIVRFYAGSEVVHRPEKYKGTGWYELKRNLDLMVNLTITLIQTIRTYKNCSLHLYCVTSPLTIPLLALIIAKMSNAETTVVSFHDLEPELAMHIKHLSRRHWLVFLEFKLERIVCHTFKKIVVTSEGQADKLNKRTQIPRSKICVIENSNNISVSKKISRSKKHSFQKNFLSPDDFVLSYVSTLSFDYTIDGLKEFLKAFSRKLGEYSYLKIVIIGGGEGLTSIKTFIIDNKLQSNVSCLGNVDSPVNFLIQSDAAIIPWKKDSLTETILPTKIFEYLSTKIPIIAPNFGEFSRILLHKKTALLYNSIEEILEFIKLLQRDNKLKTNIGIAGYNLFVSNYRPELLNNKFLSFYKQT